MKSQVIIKFEVEGFHNYPAPPSEVAFLQYPHRHTFVIQCGYRVTDLNREKEIFIQRDKVKDHILETFDSPCEFNNMSCEMIAQFILKSHEVDGMTWCEVWEEETGGSKVEL